MGLLAPSLKDMDQWEVCAKRKHTRMTLNSKRSVKVVMWKVDGSALAQVSDPPGRGRVCIALWRRMMCATDPRIKNGPVMEAGGMDAAELERDEQEEQQAQKPWSDVGPKLQSAFAMRRWPQGWI